MLNFKDKKVLIFGLGLNQGGVGSAIFFAKSGAEVRVTDLKNADVLQPSLEQLAEYKNITYTLEKHTFDDINWAELIIKNQAVKPGNQYLEYANKIGKSIETDMGVFLQYIKPSQIIGITGTKGKSTTSSLIYEMLKKAGKKVVLAGNIGVSVLETIPDVKKDTLVVLEISSFQLEAFDKHQVSPHWAVITNITPDHLNYYLTMDDYINAKKIITKYQTENDFLFVKKDNSFIDQTKAQVVYFSKDDLPKDFKPTLLGEHNLDNIAAAYQVGKAFNLDVNLLLSSLALFKGVPFRMELIKKWNGIKIYNDTAATSPESGIKSIQTFPGCILICGGMNKKMDYTKYAQVVKENVKKVFFLEGDATLEIQNLLKDTSKTYPNLEELLIEVKKFAQSGDIILFAPSATSFNLFQNEFDRGRKFNTAVEKVFG